MTPRGPDGTLQLRVWIAVRRLGPSAAFHGHSKGQELAAATIVQLRLENRALRDLALRLMVSQTHNKTEAQAERVVREVTEHAWRWSQNWAAGEGEHHYSTGAE